MRRNFQIWYAVWISDERTVFALRKTKSSARSIISDAKKVFPAIKFGFKRLIEMIPPTRRRRRRKEIEG